MSAQGDHRRAPAGSGKRPGCARRRGDRGRAHRRFRSASAGPGDRGCGDRRRPRRVPGAGAGRHAGAARRAGRRAQGDLRERHRGRGGGRGDQLRLPAQHRAADRRSGDGRVRGAPRPPAQARQGLSVRRDHQGLRRQGHGRAGAARGGRRRRLHRWPPGGRRQPGDAPRHGLRPRHPWPDHPASGGPGACPGRGDERGRGRDPPRARRHPDAGRGDHDRARPAPGRADRRPLPRRPRLDGGRRRGGAPGEGPRAPGHGGGGAAPFRAERAGGRRLSDLRQGLAAAARGGRPARRGRGPRRRHDRRHRERSLPAGPGQQATAVRSGRVRRGRARDPAADLAPAGPRRRR